jgi:flap endonuclease-1
MDCLTFGTPVLLRGFSNKDEPVIEINLEIALKELEITMDEFIDICILCGCDYCDSIDGIGPTKAHKFIKENKNIEGVLKFTEYYNLDQKKKKKYICPEENFDYEEARLLFKTPETLDPEKIELKWTTPNFEGLKEFLCKQKGFSENRIDSAIKRIEVNFFYLIFYLFFHKFFINFILF